MSQFNPLCDKDCSKAFTIQVVNNAFKQKASDVSDKILACFYNCFRAVFLKWATVTYNKFPRETIEFISASSFTDSVLKFKQQVETIGLYDGKATIKTILFGYFKNTMMNNLQTELRQVDKQNKILPENVEGIEKEKYIPTDDFKEKLLLRLNAALAKMEKSDRQIIIWRHIEQRTNEEIASLLQITIPSATNRIYRCMERLKRLIDN